MRIDVMVLDGVFDTGLAALLDAFAAAERLTRGGDDATPRFNVRRVSVRPSAVTGYGMVVPVDAVVTPDSVPPEVVVVPGMGCVTPAAVDAALERPEAIGAMAVVKAWAAAGATVAAACTGTFVVAETGLLDGRRATTTWWLETAFRKRFPAVDIDASPMVVADGPRITAGAALAHVDLALWLIRRVSPRAAHLTARFLLHAESPSQASYAMADHLAHDDDVVEAFERWTRRNLRDFDIDRAARAVGASPRTLQRRVRRALGRSPIAYVQDVRVEQALYRLRTSRDSLHDIAEAVGYADPTTLRTLLRKKTGRTVRDLRRGG